jgi:replication fork protection complex subunit Csm3/Swi3
MAPMDPPARDIPDDDELDAILNGTLDGQDIFDISNVQAQTQEPASRPQKQRANESGLGIDEEIKIVKKRQPVPKLDESRLLSDPGIPKLRRITKDRLKFKGKGHEVRSSLRGSWYNADKNPVWRHCAHAQHVPALVR